MKTFTGKRRMLISLLLCTVVFALLFSCNKNNQPKVVTTVTTEVVTTVDVTDIQAASAVSGGKLNTVGADFISCGICWDVTPNPDVVNSQKTVSYNKSTDFTLSLTGLSGGLTYYARAYVITVGGVTYGNQVQFSTPVPPIEIGQSYGGGIIFYVDKTGQHGLVTPIDDISSSAPWDNGNFKYISTIFVTDTAVGTGLANTNAIIKTLGSTTIDYAANMCKSFKLNGFTDWYLPSIDELLLLKRNLSDKGILKLPSPTYWSSSTAQVNSPYVYAQFTANADPTLVSVFDNEGVRPVRAF